MSHEKQDKWDWYAGIALEHLFLKRPEGVVMADPKVVARYAAEVADALIVERYVRIGRDLPNDVKEYFEWTVEQMLAMREAMIAKVKESVGQ